MKKKQSFIEKESKIWHKHFIPSLIAGVVIGIIAFFYNVTLTNIVLLASIGASAAILANSTSHNLLKLRTAIIAYLISIFTSVLIFYTSNLLSLNVSIELALALFIVTILLFSFDAFHPPAITASLSFVILGRPLLDLLYLFIALILLFILIRLITYTLSQNLSIRKFFKEFTRSFD